MMTKLDAHTSPSIHHSDAALAALSASAERLNDEALTLHPAERLRALRRAIDGRIVFTTSFGLEDQAILHWIATEALDIDIVTLDTGRLFPETYTLWADTEARYHQTIRAFYPDHEAVEELVARQGINGFYNSVEARQSCCHIRKVEPLGRALAGAAAWITGLRADQSRQRGGTGFAGADTQWQLIKASPLFDWTRDAVAAFAAAENIPLNPLQAAGFASIGCAPCTRALLPGEPERAGRWWWENDSKKECGLHPDGGRRQRAFAGSGG